MSRRTDIALLVGGLVLFASCANAGRGIGERRAEPINPSPAIRLLFVGDVMLGRGVAPIAEADPHGLFEDVRHVISSADLAVGNLESPLTTRPHVGDGFALEADPSTAALLARAGFDAMAIANNHAGDSGPESIIDTLVALGHAGLGVAGGGPDLDSAAAPLYFDVAGTTVALLAFDASGGGLPATDGPGVNAWSTDAALDAVTEARRQADLVAVGLHGGIEYSSIPDPQLTRLGRVLSDAGVDIIWGHGPHVSQPVNVTVSDGGHAVIAPSLGNFLFDQGRPATTVGTVLEVLADSNGVLAYRTGQIEHQDLRVDFVGWDIPSGDAVLIDREWWTIVQDATTVPSSQTALHGFPHGDLIDAAAGDVDGDGRIDVAVAYRHDFRANPVNSLFPDRAFVDREGRSAHVGLFAPKTFEPLWGAGTLFQPIGGVAACDGAMAVSYSGLDDPATVATGAWTWINFGFVIAEDLPGRGTPACADIDSDGFTEPVIVGRNG